MIDALLKKSPEFRAVWNEMPKETRRFGKATAWAKLLKDNPRLAARLSDEINDSL